MTSKYCPCCGEPIMVGQEECLNCRVYLLEVKKMAAEKRLIERIAERLKDAYPQADRNNLCPAIYYDDFVEIVDDVLSEIGESVDAVEVVHGRWTQSGEFAMCSECYDLFKEREVTVYRYCPNCGAKMDGDGNG